MLLKNGGEVGFSHVVCEGAVAENAGGVAGGLLVLAPLDDAEGEGFGVLWGDGGFEAGHQHAAADAVNHFVGDDFLFDGHAQIQAEFEQQLVKHVFVGAFGVDVVEVVEQGLRQIGGFGRPGGDVGGIEFERTKSKID